MRKWARARAAAPLGPQVSSLLGEVAAHVAGLGALQGDSLGSPTRRRESHQAGWPFSPVPGSRQRAPLGEAAPSPFCGLLSPHSPGLLPEPVPISEPHSPDSSQGCAHKEPGSRRRLLSKAQVPSESSTRLPRGHGGRFSSCQAPRAQGSCQEGGRRPGTTGPLLGKDSASFLCQL